MATTNLALALMLAPSTATDRAPPFEVANIEVERGEASSHLFAFDSDGEVSAEVIVQLDENGKPRLDAMFADGLYLTAVDGRVETDDATEVAARVSLIRDRLAPDRVQEESWTECGLSTIGAGIGCALAGPIACALATGYAICECLPVLSELTEDNAECP